MSYETGPERLRQDLADPLFTCYVHVGDESDVGWENAVFAHGLVTQLNLYLFEDHKHLKEWLGNARPKAVAFGWTDHVHATLTTAQTKDLRTVLEAIVGAQEEP